jgi:hypothetical protein
MTASNGGSQAQTVQSLNFSYAIGDGLSLTSASIAVPQLNFASPVVGNSGAKLDGNAPANRVAGITFQVSGINWESGQQLLLKYSHPVSSGSNAGLAIDNFQFSASTTAVPEPSTCLMLATASLLFVGYRRRARIA